MKIDAISIFPEYFDVLEISLLGKARQAGIISFQAHNLRSWTQDRHRTVDASPYGGGAGMVMKPEPWGLALDALAIGSNPTIIFPTPSGELFTQEIAQDLATRSHLIFACGRYEGIDQRVVDHFSEDFEVRELSIGDFVLNGGEVASIAIVEALARLIPGVLGNPGSLAEESFSNGLLEYPHFTSPRRWRGLEVPNELVLGHHAEADKWRLNAARSRTAKFRPELLSGTDVDG